MEEEQDIYSDIVERDQLLDAQKNKEFDDAVAGGGLEDLKEGVKIRKKENQLLGSKLLDSIQGKIVEAGTSIMEAAQEDPDTWTDDLIRLGLGGAKNVGNVLNAPGIKQALQALGAPTWVVGKGLGWSLEKAGVDPRYGQIVGEVGEWFIPFYGAGKLVKKAKGLATALNTASDLRPRSVGAAARRGSLSPSSGDIENIESVLNPERLARIKTLKTNLLRKIDDGYIEEIVEKGDDVIYPPGSKEADILASTQALGPGGKITDLNADKLSIDGLKKQLDDDISFKLGYNPDEISKTLYKAKLKAADGTVMPSEIATPFVRHGEAFLKANPTKTLEEFPHLWWKGEAWVLKGRNRYKTVNGKKQFVRKEVQIERWTDRKARAKLGKDARSLRVKEQSPGVKKGTFAYEKVKQLRERNIKREAAGLSPLRLRDSDLDHINALRSVGYYTKGMPEDFKKLIYQDLGKEGLFTGDHASNLKLREREVHRALWPELKRRLNLLGHKHTGFKTPEARYNYYKEINPKTGVTRLEEYAETVYAVEELGDDMMEQLLNTAKNKNIKSPSDPVKEALIKILGSEEDYTVFMNRLEDFPENMRKDFIIEEIKYHE